MSSPCSQKISKYEHVFPNYRLKSIKENKAAKVSHQQRGSMSLRVPSLHPWGVGLLLVGNGFAAFYSFFMSVWRANSSLWFVDRASWVQGRGSRECRSGDGCYFDPSHVQGDVRSLLHRDGSNVRRQGNCREDRPGRGRSNVSPNTCRPSRGSTKGEHRCVPQASRENKGLYQCVSQLHVYDRAPLRSHKSMWRLLCTGPLRHRPTSQANELYSQ